MTTLAIGNQILAARIAALAAITKAGGYSIDAPARIVRRPFRVTDLADGATVPLAVVYTGTPEVIATELEQEGVASGEEHHVLDFYVGILDFTDEDDVDQVGRELAADLVQAITTKNGAELADEKHTLYGVMPRAVEVLTGLPSPRAVIAAVFFRAEFDTLLGEPRIGG